jgi:hypothetical protein
MRQVREDKDSKEDKVREMRRKKIRRGEKKK